MAIFSFKLTTTKGLRADVQQKLKMITEKESIKADKERAELQFRNTFILHYTLSKRLYENLMAVNYMPEGWNAELKTEPQKIEFAINYFIKEFDKIETKFTSDETIAICEMNNRRIEVESRMFSQKKFFDQWKSRSTAAEYEYGLLSKECDEQLSDLLEIARKQFGNGHKNAKYLQEWDENQNKDNEIYRIEFFCWLYNEVGTRLARA